MNITPKHNAVTLTLPATRELLKIATGCVENTAFSLGLRDEKLTKLLFATEEIFLHLARVTGKGKILSIQIEKGSTAVILCFYIESKAVNLKAMNIVSSDEIGKMLEDEDFNRMGLLFAVTFIDNFRIEHTGNHLYKIFLKQQKEYPEITKKDAIRIHAEPPFSIEENLSAASLQYAAEQAFLLYPDHIYSTTFRQPGRFSDMVKGGELKAIILKDSIGRICGLTVWETKEKSVSFYGPYLFIDNLRKEASEKLVDSFISRVARNEFLMIFTSQATEDLPTEQFDELGTLRYCRHGNDCMVIRSYGRHLREDSGIAVWSHPRLTPFLKREYSRLVMLRDIRETGSHGTREDDASVFAVELDRRLSQAVIRPMLNGNDIRLNLELHITSLAKRGINNIVCIIDLGYGWQAEMADLLMDLAFSPQLLQPLAGKGDFVIFQYTNHKTIL